MVTIALLIQLRSDNTKSYASYKIQAKNPKARVPIEANIDIQQNVSSRQHNKTNTIIVLENCLLNGDDV